MATQPKRPPLIWNVNIVLKYIHNLGPNEHMSIMNLGAKCATLFMTTTMRRKQDLCYLNLNDLTWGPGFSKATFTITTPMKTYTMSTKPKIRDNVQNYTVEAFPEEPFLCPTTILSAYIQKMAPLRTVPSLFITTYHPFHRAASGTLHRWIKNLLKNAGIDIQKYNVHSIRSATSSAAALSGISVDRVIQQAGWTSNSTFVKCYLKNVITPNKVIPHYDSKPFLSVIKKPQVTKQHRPWYQKYCKHIGVPLHESKSSSRHKAWHLSAWKNRRHLEDKTRTKVDALVNTLLKPILTSRPTKSPISPVPADLHLDNTVISITDSSSNLSTVYLQITKTLAKPIQMNTPSNKLPQQHLTSLISHYLTHLY